MSFFPNIDRKILHFSRKICCALGIVCCGRLCNFYCPLSTVQILPKDQPRWFEQMESKDNALHSSNSIDWTVSIWIFLCSLSQPQPPIGWSLTSLFSTNTSISQMNHSHQINRVNLVATCTLINHKITDRNRRSRAVGCYCFPILLPVWRCPQCFEAIDWVAGRASSL